MSSERPLSSSEQDQLDRLSDHDYTDPDARDIVPEDLRRAMSLEEAEALIARPEDFPLEVEELAVMYQVAHLNILCSWVRLLKKHQPGDELHHFCTSQDHWDSMCGREGIALSRDSQVVDCLVLRMN